MFSLEKPKVYERALASVAGLAQLSTNWDKRHAVVDQLLRASESVVLNLAEGARLRGGPQSGLVPLDRVGPPGAGVGRNELTWIKCGIKCGTKSRNDMSKLQSPRSGGPD